MPFYYFYASVERAITNHTTPPVFMLHGSSGAIKLVSHIHFRDDTIFCHSDSHRTPPVIITGFGVHIGLEKESHIITGFPSSLHGTPPVFMCLIERQQANFSNDTKLYLSYGVFQDFTWVISIAGVSPVYFYFFSTFPVFQPLTLWSILIDQPLFDVGNHRRIIR